MPAGPGLAGPGQRRHRETRLPFSAPLSPAALQFHEDRLPTRVTGTALRLAASHVLSRPDSATPIGPTVCEAPLKMFRHVATPEKTSRMSAGRRTLHDLLEILRNRRET
jgi:hypothetical protein